MLILTGKQKLSDFHYWWHLLALCWISRTTEALVAIRLSISWQNIVCIRESHIKYKKNPIILFLKFSSLPLGIGKGKRYSARQCSYMILSPVKNSAGLLEITWGWAAARCVFWTGQKAGALGFLGMALTGADLPGVLQLLLPLACSSRDGCRSLL